MAAMTIQEAATQLDISPQTVRRMLDRGDVHSWKTPGGHRRLDSTVVDSILAARKPRAKGK